MIFVGDKCVYGSGRVIEVTMFYDADLHIDTFAFSTQKY